MALPFTNTTVSARSSMTSIQDMFENTGFEQIANITDRGVYKIIATYKRQPFEFEIDVQNITTAMINDLGPRTQSNIRQKTRNGRNRLEQIQLQALKVGWRLMFIHIKALCDSIKLGVISPSQAFAGYALIMGPDKHPITLAQSLTQRIETGQPLTEANILMLEAPHVPD